MNPLLLLLPQVLHLLLLVEALADLFVGLRVLLGWGWLLGCRLDFGLVGVLSGRGGPTTAMAALDGGYGALGLGGVLLRRLSVIFYLLGSS